MVRAELVHPFVESIHELFETMLGMEARVGEVIEPVPEEQGAPVIIGVIGMSGTAKGTVAAKLPVKTALKLVGRMVGTEFETLDRSIVDGIGEFVNILAGIAKKRYSGHKISLSLPTVVRGDLFILNEKGQGTIWSEIPVESECGPFRLAVGLSSSFAQKKEQVNEGVGS